MVNRVASLVKLWLLGTNQGAVNATHLPSYLDEFVYRFNRRHSRSRGMVFCRVLELALDDGPVRHHEVLASSRPRDENPARHLHADINPGSRAPPRTDHGEPAPIFR